MRLENSFVVPAPPDRVWDFMMDVERVAPCMPGAELTETIDDTTWKGKVSVKIGPVGLAFTGKLKREQADESERRVVLNAQGTETRGKGTAAATVTSRLEPTDEGTRVVVITDLQISGAVAQYGRGMLADVSQRFTDEFAACLAEEIGRSGDGGAEPDGGGAARERAGAEAAGGRGGAAGGAAGVSDRGAGAAGGRQARPVSGIRLGIWALWRAVKRGIGRLFGSGSPPGE